MLRSATAKMLPPRPPSPPSGPPRGTNFSRRNDAEPSPPLPAWTSMVTSSMNFICGCKQKSPAPGQGFSIAKEPRLRRKHVDRVLFVRPFDCELDLARNFREQRVVPADANVDTGVHPGAALAYDDAAGFDQFAAERFDAKPLRV